MFVGAVLRPRCGGKSYELANIAKRNPHAVVVVLTQELREHFSHYFNVPKKQILTFGELRRGALRGRIAGPLLFDNFEYMLPELLGGTAGVTPDLPIIISATGVNL